MAIGLSLHIGLNSVDPNHYQGWSGPLVACEADARDMAALAAGCGFKTEVLLTKSATRSVVLSRIAQAASNCSAGDFYLLTNSSHGGQVPDLNGDEADGLDETICLYDGELIDDELYAALAGFKAGVRVFVLSDSCHSGTVTKELVVKAAAGPESSVRYRAMPQDVAFRVYQANKAFYDGILTRKDLAEGRKAAEASVLLISGCQDNQLSQDGPFNGAFTGALKRVWNGGLFKGDYRDFHIAIQNKLPSDQSPNLFWANKIDTNFEAQRPFTI
jgi:metacaspase-1